MSCTLVLLPGMDGTGELFRPLVDALGSDVPTHIVRYPDQLFGYAEHEAFARTCLPTDRPYVVLGESFSGPIAISIAASRPPGLLAYVLCASFVCCPRPVLRLISPALPLFPPHHVPSALVKYFLMGRRGSQALQDAHERVLHSVSPHALRARLNAIANIDVRSQLARVQLPGSYLRATEDRLVPVSATRAFARLATGARVVDLEGPHFLLQTNPSAAADVLRQFLAEVRASRRQGQHL